MKKLFQRVSFISDNEVQRNLTLTSTFVACFGLDVAESGFILLSVDGGKGLRTGGRRKTNLEKKNE